MVYIDDQPFLGTSVTLADVELVLTTHRLGAQGGPKKPLNKNGSIKVNNLSMPIADFYNTCADVALELRSWDKVCLGSASACCVFGGLTLNCPPPSKCLY